MSVTFFNSEKKAGIEEPSFDDVLLLANGLSKGSHSEDMAHVLKAATLAHLDPIENEIILAAIQAKTKLPKSGG